MCKGSCRAYARLRDCNGDCNIVCLRHRWNRAGRQPCPAPMRNFCSGKSHQKRPGARNRKGGKSPVRAHPQSIFLKAGTVAFSLGWVLSCRSVLVVRALPRHQATGAHRAEGSGETCAALPQRFPSGFGYFWRPKVPPWCRIGKVLPYHSCRRHTIHPPP